MSILEGEAMTSWKKQLFAGIPTGLLLVLSAPTSAEGGPVASTTVQQEFDAFLAKFRAALTANDAAAVAGMTQLPFMPYLDGGGGGSDVAEFRAKSYPRFFTAKTRRCLARTNALYDRGRDGGESFVIFCGNLGFYFQKTQKGFLFTEIGPDD